MVDGICEVGSAEYVQRFCIVITDPITATRYSVSVVLLVARHTTHSLTPQGVCVCVSVRAQVRTYLQVHVHYRLPFG